MKNQEFYTLKQLSREVGCQFYVIDYLRRCNRLPLVRKPVGSGHPALFHPDCIEIVRNHVDKNRLSTSRP